MEIWAISSTLKPWGPLTKLDATPNMVAMENRCNWLSIAAQLEPASYLKSGNRAANMVGGQKSKRGTKNVKSCCARTKLDAGTNLVPKDRGYCWPLIATKSVPKSDLDISRENQN